MAGVRAEPTAGGIPSRLQPPGNELAEIAAVGLQSSGSENSVQERGVQRRRKECGCGNLDRHTTEVRPGKRSDTVEAGPWQVIGVLRLGKRALGQQVLRHSILPEQEAQHEELQASVAATEWSQRERRSNTIEEWII